MRFFISAILLLSATAGRSQSPLFIPPALSGTSFSLNVQTGIKVFFTGYNTPTYGINGNILAPTLIMNQGDSVNIDVTNNLPVSTTMHWHGLHVPPEYDGGPMQLINPGSTWQPKFKVLNSAGTYWYHPHGAGKTDLHVSKGLAGMIIVKDPVEAALTLPRSYGVDDFPLIVQSKAFDVLRQIAIATEDDTLLMVNGTPDPYLDAPAQVIRFRLLNGSSMRSYLFGFSGNLPFSLIATDAGLVANPVPLTRIRLAPGERVEILLNLNGMTGQTIYLKNLGSELPNGIYGAATVGMGAAMIPGYGLNPKNGADYNLMKINVVAPTSSPVTTIPSALVTLTPWPLSAVDTTRIFSFDPETPDSSKFAEGPFDINGQKFSMDTINVITKLNNTEIWTLINNTMVAHPFHIHDVYFYILDINGVPPPAYEAGKKDVVLVMPGDTVRFLTKFETFADPMMSYMYHCHLLHHEDDGMMGQFIVMPNDNHIGQVKTELLVKLYPNPADNELNVQVEQTILHEQTSIRVTDVLGRDVYNNAFFDRLKINTSAWHCGLYTIFLHNSSGTTIEKIAIN